MTCQALRIQLLSGSMDPVRQLQDLIDEYGLSDLAGKIGIPRQYLYQIVQKDRPPSKKVLKYLGIRRETKYVKVG